jgi:acyl carrier protein
MNMRSQDVRDKGCPEYELLVATHVVRALAALGVHAPTVDQLINDDDSRVRDLALLGLSSLDWMALATRLEYETGLEIPDHALTQSRHRCVAGWATALADRKASNEAAPYSTQDDED